MEQFLIVPSIKNLFGKKKIVREQKLIIGRCVMVWLPVAWARSATGGHAGDPQQIYHPLQISTTDFMLLDPIVKFVLKQIYFIPEQFFNCYNNTKKLFGKKNCSEIKNSY